ncbi:MAG TPA: serine/threonine-protein kinase [Candidatus Polarisedimenticolia bacterium]|nr:serine/threonine-protein kinase [Candidatus Polarisedimenticolia bacterium]
MPIDERLAHLQAVADLPDLTGTRYRLLRRLGRGGMATVYLVEDTALGREAALKVLSEPDPSGALAQRLTAEARLLARIEHPNLVPVHDVGALPDGRIFYVMQYVRGERLDAWIRRPRTRPEVLRLFVKLADAVAFAHAQGAVHRDLKPENIMVGAFGEALVMDWGVAKLLGTADVPTLALPDAGDAAGSAGGGANASVTAAGTLVGTPAWMAPEQARGEVDRIDARTDVHALGALLYYLLAGRPPFAGDGREAIRRVVEETPASLRGLDPSIPKPLAAIAARALEKEPAARYETARALAADVERFLDGLPVAAYRESWLERAGRVLSRSRTLVALLAAYLLMRVIILLFFGR